MAELLRPVASPVDTFVRPERSRLWGALEGLEKLDRGVSSFVAKRREEATREDAIRGEAAFYSNNEEGYAEAVRSGDIPAHASPFFKRAYKQAEGSLAGTKLQQEFSAAYQTWEGKESNDPAAFDEFYKGFVADRLKGVSDPDTLAGLIPALREGHTKFGNAHTEYLAERTYKQGVDAHVAAATSAIDDEEVEGLGREEGTDYEGMWANLTGERRDAALASGVRPEDYDKALFETIAAKAIEHRDPKLLEMLERNVPGQDYAFSDTEEGRKLYADTVDNLTTISVQAEEREWRMQERRDKQAKEEATAAILERIASDPNAPIPEEVLAAASKLDPEIRVRALGWQKAMAEGTVREDPRAVTEVYEDIMRGEGLAAITRASDAGSIRDASTLSSALSFLKSFEESGGADGLLKSSQAKSVMDTLRIRTMPDEFAEGLFDPGGLSDAGRVAQYDFQRILMDWTLRNPDASELEKMEAVAKIGDTILKGIVKREGGGFERYESPAEALQFENPARPEPSQEESGAAAPQVPPSLDQLPEAERGAIEAEAKAQGITSDQLLREMWQMTRSGGSPGTEIPGDYQRQLRPGQKSDTFGPPIPPDPNAWQGFRMPSQDTINEALDTEEPSRLEAGLTTLADTISTAVARSSQEAVELPAEPGPEEQASAPQAARAAKEIGAAIEGYLAEQGERAAKPKALLHFIGDLEAPAGYGTVFGNNQDALSKPLTSMTVGEVLASQRGWTRKFGSSAAGRYQFVRRTLKGLVEELGVSPEDLFGARLQDKLGMALLRRRGLYDYRAGRITRQQFAANLAKEWASLPAPNTGRSHYAGDGRNRALTSTGAVEEAISGARAPPRRRDP